MLVVLAVEKSLLALSRLCNRPSGAVQEKGAVTKTHTFGVDSICISAHAHRVGKVDRELKEMRKLLINVPQQEMHNF